MEHRSPVVNMSAPMSERIRLWREDYPHFAADPVAMVETLLPLKPLVGGGVIAGWRELAEARRIDELFESIMTLHYDPCYSRSTRRNYGPRRDQHSVDVPSLSPEALARTAAELIAVQRLIASTTPRP